MTNRWYRFGAWVASISTVLSSILVPSQSAWAAPADFATSNVPTTVVLNEVLPAPLAGTAEFIELYNATSTMLSLQGWRLINAAGTTLATFGTTDSIGALSMKTVDFAGNVLGDTVDTVRLVHADGSWLDSLSYGGLLGGTATVPAPDSGKALARRADAELWYSNLAATKTATNGPALALSAPTKATVAAGSGNAESIINRSNLTPTRLAVTLPASSVATDTIVAGLWDSASTSRTAVQTASTGAGTLTFGWIDTTASPAFVDGQIAARAYIQDSQGVRTSYSPTTLGTRDTSNPAAITAVSLPAGANNPTQTINSATQSTVAVSVTAPASALATDMVRISLSDGTRTVTKDATPPAGGGTFTIQGFNLAAFDTASLADGTLSLSAMMQDAAGNQSTSTSGPAVAKDTRLPTASVTINDGQTATNANEVTLRFSAEDVGSGIESMRVSNSSDFTGVSFEPFMSQRQWFLSGTAGGFKSVYVQAKDLAGNVSETVRQTIMVQFNLTSLSRHQLATGTQSIRQLPIDLEVTTNAQTLLTIAEYGSNPGNAFSEGTVPVGRFFEVGVADSTKVNFPLLVKVFYTEADLTNTGVTTESQLTGLGFFDQATTSWQLFDSTGVVTTNQVVGGVSYAGYLFANAEHLTPTVGFADTTAPSQPTKVSPTASDGTVSVSWESIPDAASYVLRYRKVGESDSAFKSVTLSSTVTSTMVRNLENETLYEFQIAAVDASGNQSNFASVTAFPQKPQPAEPTSPVVSAPEGTSPPGTGTNTVRPVTPKPTPAVTESPTTPSPTEPSLTDDPATADGKDQASDLGRLLVILAILAIAIGAGTLGFYGFEWWAGRGQTAGKPTPPPTAPPVKPVAPEQPQKPVPPKPDDQRGPKPPKTPQGRW